VFLAQTYYFTDYAAAGIGPPPRGYRWVRYGPDLVLVQRRTGRITQVIYNAFL
jgi:Ni/Co efflux regulator RcnB